MRLTIVLIFALLVSAVNIPLLASAEQNNLVQNNSFVVQSAGQPTGWEQNSWGTSQSTFSLNSDGVDDAASAHVGLANYQDGDAKWLFGDVAVEPSHDYIYSDYSRSNVTTNLWARYTLQDGTKQYAWLGSVAANASWQRKVVSLKTPVATKSVTVFHVISDNGFLDIDNVSLVDAASCSQLLGALPNGTFESNCLNETAPDNWASHTSGSVAATFQYENSLQGKGVSMQVQSTAGGEASWMSAVAAVSGGNRYKVAFDYASTTYVYAYVEYHFADGTLGYTPLSSIASSGMEWSTYSDMFVAPTNVVGARVYIATGGVGSVHLDNVSLNQVAPAPNPGAKGIVSITFDDGKSSSYVNGFPVLKTYGLPSTWYINAGALNTSTFLTNAQVKNLANAGQEIASHAYQHVDLVGLTQPQRVDQITKNYTALKSLTGKSISDFAAPFGSYNSNVLSAVSVYHQTNRDTSGQINYLYNYNPMMLHGVLVTKTMTAADIDILVAKAEQQKAWLVLVYHDIAATGDSYTVTKNNLTAQLKVIKSHNVSVLTVDNAYKQFAK